MSESAELFQSHRNRRLAFWGSVGVVVLFAVYGAFLIARSSFELDSKRFYCLFDDAMVSFGYARHWVNGHGLVWNVGEAPVEGYTNFGWVVVMAGVHLLFSDAVRACLAMQVVGLLCACGYVIGAARLGFVLGMGPKAVVLGCLLVAAFYNLTYFSVLGLEPSLVAALVTFAVVSVVRTIGDGRVRVTPFVLLAVGGLVRMDVVLCTAILTLAMMVKCRGQVVRITLLAGLAVVPILLHMLWRHSYYGEWLPNTYYMKVTGWPLGDRLWNGMLMSLGTTRRLFVPMLVVFCAVLLGRRGSTALVLGTFATLMAYQTWVGGDSWPRDRFLSPIMPSMLMVTCGAIASAGEKMKGWMSGWRHVRLPVVVGLFAAVPLTMNQDVWREALLLESPMYTEDNMKNLSRAFAMEEATTEDALIGLYWAGSVPYFIDRACLDFLGKSDKVIARMPIRRSPDRMGVGHKKWSWTYSLGHRKPDVITRRDGQYLLHSKRFQKNYLKACLGDDAEERVTFWVRRDSKRVRWPLVRFTKDHDPHNVPAMDDPPGDGILPELGEGS